MKGRRWHTQEEEDEKQEREAKGMDEQKEKAKNTQGKRKAWKEQRPARMDTTVMV